MIDQVAKGQALVDPALVSRVNPWLFVAIVAAVLLLAIVLVLVAQPIFAHAMGGILQQPRQMAPVCSGLPIPC